MDKLLYISMSGARETMVAQSTLANNLANMSTTGFKADLEGYLSQPVYGPGYPSRAYALTQDYQTMDFSPGSINTTGRSLDLAINGDGWMEIQTQEGGIGLTRRGDLYVDINGMLLTGDGDPLMGENGPIAVPPFDAMSIGNDGTITIQPIGQAIGSLAIVDRIMLVNPDLKDLQKDGNGVVTLKEGANELLADASIRLISGALETSNVSGVGSMVRMIELQRHYELQVKMMSTAKENDEATSQLMRIG